MIEFESAFGLHPLTARDANAMHLRQVLRHEVASPVPPAAIPTSHLLVAERAAMACSRMSRLKLVERAIFQPR